MQAALEGLRNIREQGKIGHSLLVPQVLVRHFYLPLTLNNIILNMLFIVHREQILKNL